MKKYDIVIAGASTTGAWFAKKMAELGHSVLVIEKQEAENVSREYDVFHMGKADMEKFDLVIPPEGDPIREFCFGHSTMISPYGNYPKACAEAPVIGLHKHDYIMAMAERARDAGAEIIYGASFTDFIYDNNKRIIGAKYKTNDGENEAYARIVADCSGIPAVARTKLPDTSVVGNFKLTNKDILYVVLYYAEYLKKDLERGVYKICSNYFASHQTSLTGAATITVCVYTDWGTKDEKFELITFRLDKPKKKLLIGEVKL